MRGIKVTFYGGMTILLENEAGFKLLLDPYFNNNPHQVCKASDFYDVDLIAVTHNANDHYGDTTEILKNSNASLLACNDVVARARRECGGCVDAARLYTTIYGDEKEFDGVSVRTVLAQHISRTEYENGVASFAPPLGFVVQFENGVTYYHGGDTSIYGDMKLIRDLYRPNIACLSIDRWRPRTGKVLPPREAAMAADWLGVDVVIPGHYAPGSNAPQEFIQMMRAFAPTTQIRGEMKKPFYYIPYEVCSAEEMREEYGN